MWGLRACNRVPNRPVDCRNLQTEIAEERTKDHGTTSSQARRSDRGGFPYDMLVTSHYFASVALSVRGWIGAWPGLVDGTGTRPGESGRAGLCDLGGLDSGCREKVLAFVPTNLVPLYSTMDLFGNVFSLNHFTIESLHIHPPMFEHYQLCIKDWVIIIHHNTILTRLPHKFVGNFPIYPLVSSITSLLQDNTNRRMLIDVVGKIIWDVRIIKHFLAYHLILLNEMGNIIHLYLNRIPYHRMVSVILAKHHRSIIYVSRVKLVHRPQLNFNEDNRQRKSTSPKNNEVGEHPTKKRKIYNARYQDKKKEKVRTLIDITNATPTSILDVNLSNDGNIIPPIQYQFISQSSTSIDDGSVDQSMLDDPYDFLFVGIPTRHRELKLRKRCESCQAERLKYETDSFCCMNGKTKLVHSSIPDELHNLFTADTNLGKMFRETIRAYNTNFSFASMGVSLDQSLANNRDGIYHRIDQLVPRDGRPRYLQLYFYDSENEMLNRLEWPNLDSEIVQILTRVLASNPYVATFRTLADLGPLDNYRVTLNASLELDQRVYNRPTTSEVAGIWVEGNNNITAYKRSIVVYGRSERPQTIQQYWSCYDPLCYPLFFPNVSIDEIVDDEEIEEEDEEDAGTTSSRKIVTMREYYCYKFQIRPHGNVILLGGRLFQQFMVDSYVKIDTSQLYQGVVDANTAGDVPTSMIGQRVVLPASFIGGPRDMRRRFLDAMALVQDGGKPDIFLTMTCNPKCPEIQNELLSWQKAKDRPDVVSIVFHAKIEDLKEQLLKRDILGVVRAYVYVIEFQKRGLPHAHFLLIMRPGSKFTNPDYYDKYVCAEIPNPAKFPVMHELVKKHMIHGPCGDINKKCLCMQGVPLKCRFKYPLMDNRWVVPYNPKLLMMFNCHLNVEICSSITSVKYIFKYIYKGHDKQVIPVDQDAQRVELNEIKSFQDARYVSPPEAIWRIFSFPLAKIYPNVVTLQVHLPNQQMVRFSTNEAIDTVVERERNKRSMLTEFFETNKVDLRARQHLYKDFPKHLTSNKTTRLWKARIKGKALGRLVSANPAEGERYYLRLLLCHVTGPTCFEDLYTYNNLIHPTFRKAALERGLIESDQSLSQCLAESSLFQFHVALRRLFATILVFCDPGDVRKLWNDHYHDMSEDYMRQNENVERVQNMVLTDINLFLESMGKSIDDFDLPTIDRDVDLQSGGFCEVQEESSIVVEDDHLRAQEFLNTEQKYAYDEIMRHVRTNCAGVFFIDGPGGTGKTYLYKALLPNVCKCVCNVKKQSGTAQLLRIAKLII
ncbi:hypothetical protein LXL04_006945 [Taraxacum kok-saghyz]